MRVEVSLFVVVELRANRHDAAASLQSLPGSRDENFPWAEHVWRLLFLFFKNHCFVLSYRAGNLLAKLKFMSLVFGACHVAIFAISSL